MKICKSKGDYALVDGLAKKFYASARQAGAYRGFLPIITCIAAALALPAFLKSTAAAMPLSLRADASERTAPVMALSVPAITTPATNVSPVIGNLSGPNGPMSIQPILAREAAAKAPSIWSASMAASLSPGATAKSNCIPANKRIFSETSLRFASSSDRGALSLANSNWASAARALASVTRRSPYRFAILSNASSPHTPKKIRAFAAIVSAASSFDFPRMQTEAISTSRPSRIRRANLSAHPVNRSYFDWNSLSGSAGGLIRHHKKRTGLLETAAAVCAIASLVALVWVLAK